MKNNYCKLSNAQILALPSRFQGFLLSPFQFNERGGMVGVPEDTFTEMISIIAEYAQLASNAATAAPGDLTQVGAHAWFHRGMANFDAEEVLATLDDGKGTPIPLYIASNAGAAPGIPEGCAIVPVAITPEMKQAGGHVNSEWLNDYAPIGEARYAMPMESVWKAMLDAAPSNPPVGAKESRPDGWIALAMVRGECTSVAFADEKTAREICAEGEPFPFWRHK